MNEQPFIHPDVPNDIVVPPFLEQPLAHGVISEGLACIAFASQLQSNFRQHADMMGKRQPDVRGPVVPLPIPRMPDGLFRQIDRRHGRVGSQG